MKKIASMLLFLFLIGSTLQGAGFEKHGQVGDLHIDITSKKSLVKGLNDLTIQITKDGKYLNDAKVIFKVFMPQMPGMPYMEDKKKAKFIKDGKYIVKVNFSMRGTWQIRVYITTKDGEKYLYKSSVNI
ncbi:MAG TPA: hypothetical protein EYP79_02180 [Campylobacterales bacterium]|nr:hypothetical protein [Campylobacterales bacterium]